MEEFPAVGTLGRGGEVLGVTRQFRIIGQNGAAAACGDDLVTVETERAQFAEGAGVPALMAAAQRLGGVFHHG